MWCGALRWSRWWALGIWLGGGHADGLGVSDEALWATAVFECITYEVVEDWEFNDCCVISVIEWRLSFYAMYNYRDLSCH